MTHSLSHTHHYTYIYLWINIYILYVYVCMCLNHFFEMSLDWKTEPGSRTTQGATFESTRYRKTPEYDYGCRRQHGGQGKRNPFLLQDGPC